MHQQFQKGRDVATQVGCNKYPFCVFIENKLGLLLSLNSLKAVLSEWYILYYRCSAKWYYRSLQQSLCIVYCCIAHRGWREQAREKQRFIKVTKQTQRELSQQPPQSRSYKYNKLMDYFQNNPPMQTQLFSTLSLVLYISTLLLCNKARQSPYFNLSTPKSTYGAVLTCRSRWLSHCKKAELATYIHVHQNLILHNIMYMHMSSLEKQGVSGLIVLVSFSSWHALLLA